MATKNGFFLPDCQNYRTVQIERLIVARPGDVMPIKWDRLPPEVLTPDLAARVNDGNHVAGFRINSCFARVFS
jgi:hypothetical protein